MKYTFFKNKYFEQIVFLIFTILRKIFEDQKVRCERIQGRVLLFLLQVFADTVYLCWKTRLSPNSKLTYRKITTWIFPRRLWRAFLSWVIPMSILFCWNLCVRMAETLWFPFLKSLLPVLRVTLCPKTLENHSPA